MTRFQFRLQSVLRWRQAQLDAERAKLEQLVAEQRKVNAAVEALRNERAQAKAFLSGKSDLQGVELRLVSSFLLGVEARAAKLRDHLRAITQSVEAQRKQVARADRNVRLLNKLREKKLEEWKQEADREIETLAQESWMAAQHGSRRD